AEVVRPARQQPQRQLQAGQHPDRGADVARSGDLPFLARLAQLLRRGLLGLVPGLGLAHGTPGATARLSSRPTTCASIRCTWPGSEGTSSITSSRPKAMVTEKPSANRFRVGATRLSRPEPNCTAMVANTSGRASISAAEKIQPTPRASRSSAASESDTAPTGQTWKLRASTWVTSRWPSKAKNSSTNTT